MGGAQGENAARDPQYLDSVSMSCFSSDASLSLHNVLDVVKTVDTETLEDVLLVPDRKRDTVAENSTSDEEIREKFVKYFLQTSPFASWEDLGGELLFYECNAALQATKTYIKREEGMLWYSLSAFQMVRACKHK